MTKVLICYYHRPMCVGLFYRRAFEQAGCEVISCGPAENMVYGHSDWRDFRPPDVELPMESRQTDVNDVIDKVAASRNGWRPDLVVMIDQYDFFYLTGSIMPGTGKFVYLAVENWNQEQANRANYRQADIEYYMICHDSNGQHPAPPFVPGSEWQVFGADKEIHPYTKPMAERSKWVCQIGTHYEPRPTVWNYLRKRFDDAEGYTPDGYSKTLHESEHTLFGRVFNYAGMSDAYNDAVCALSCSNVDFIPMRIAEAFAMGNVLISDDVPSMRAAFGAPWPSNPDGIWVAYDRSHDMLGNIIEELSKGDRADAIAITDRARKAVDEKWQYRINAEKMLKRAGF